MQRESEARDREMSQGLLRQRRNLMGISILLPLYLFSGFSLDKINILGNQVNINNPKIITISMIVLFFYYFLRYWQYFNEENYVKEAKNNLQSVQYKYVYDYIKKKIYSQNKKYKDSILNLPHPQSLTKYFFHEDTDSDNIKPKYSQLLFNTFVVNASLQKRPRYNNDEDGLENQISLMKERLENDKRFEYVEKKDSIDRSDFYKYRLEVTINAFYVYVLKLKGFLKFIITESIFTDYYLPFLVSTTSFVLLCIWLIFHT